MYTGMVFLPSWMEILTTTFSIARVQRVVMSGAFARFTRFSPHSMEVISTPNASSPHSATTWSSTLTSSCSAILDTADPGSSFAGNDRFYHERLRFALFGNPLVVTAGRAPDEQVAGFGDHFVLGLIFALGAGGGDKH